MQKLTAYIPVGAIKSARFQFANMYAMTFNAQFGFHLLYPLLAFIFFSKNTPLFLASATLAERSVLYGFCLSFTRIGGLIANMIVPIISDYYGRKLAWIISSSSLLLLTLFCFAGLLLHNPYLFVVGFFLHGVLDAHKSTGLASISDQSAKSDLVTNMGMLQSMIAMGACIGPILGGFLAEEYAWFGIAYIAPFLLSFTIGIISLIQALKYKEAYVVTQQTGFRSVLTFNIKTIAQDYYQLIRQRSILKLFTILILSQFSWSVYYQFIGPFLKTTFNFSPFAIGMFMGSIALWLVLAASILLRVLKRYFTEQQILFGSIVGFAGGIFTTFVAIFMPALFSTQTLFWMSAIPIAMGDVLIFSLLAARLSQEIPASQHGKAMGLHLVIAMLVWSLTALFGGYMMKLSLYTVFCFMPIGVFILLVFMRALTPSIKPVPSLA